MRPVILLDIDGVLDPAVRPKAPGENPVLFLSDSRLNLVRRLAQCGLIAWASTWPASQTAALEGQLQLGKEPLRVPLPPTMLAQSHSSTPKLPLVNRWLARMEVIGDADWDSVVWIDDMLNSDAYSWAQQHALPVQLIRPLAATGLTVADVELVEQFAAQEP